MKQNLISSQSLGTFPSPGAASASSSYQDKGWSSERVPRPSSGSSRRRHISALTPFYSGRTLPSKWEDAERWISSPVLGYGVAKNSQSSMPHRRPKSKSGPIVPPGVAFYSNSSPSMQALDGGSIRNFMVNSPSPFSTGVLMPNGVGVHYGGGGIGSQANVSRSTSVPAWSDMVSESSLPSSQDEKLHEINETENTVACVISRRDMATQMSPDGSTHSSPSPRGGNSSSLDIPQVTESDGDHPAKIKEVKIDKRATTVTRRSKRLTIQKGQPEVDDYNQVAIVPRNSPWNISEAASDFSKWQREEAKITAWENLQKAKAEAAIRQLEMKLEKKRSSSMDKILNKLETAEMKAQEMRSLISDKGDKKMPDTSNRINFFRKHVKLSSFSGCFACHAL